MEAFNSADMRPAENLKSFYLQESDFLINSFQVLVCKGQMREKESETDRLRVMNGVLQEDNQKMKKEVEDLKTQLEQYKLVSQSFEKRVLDLQIDLMKKDDEIAGLKKKEEVLRHNSNYDGSSKTKESNAEKSKGTEPEQFRKLFIGGLNYSTTDDSLREYFSKFGELVDCVVMKDASSKRSRGFGFIVYSQISMVDAAQAARPHIVDGREVETKRAVPKGEPQHHENQIRVKKIFVGGLKDTTDEANLLEYFSQFGCVDHVDLIEDRQTKRLRGFAYVTFNDYDPVDKAVLQKYHTIDGRRCEVKKALSKMEMRTLKGDIGFQSQCNMWPAGPHCSPNSGNGNACGAARNFRPSCNMSGFGPGCSGVGNFNGLQGPSLGNYGGNMNQGGWNQCGGWNPCSGPRCSDNYHGWQGHEKFNGESYHGKGSNSMRCPEHSQRGGAHWGRESNSSHRAVLPSSEFSID